MLLKVKSQEPADHLMKELHEARLDSLMNSQATDEEIKAFWINVYNSYTISLIEDNPDVLSDNLSRISYFSKKQIPVGGRMLSFNDIEHGILRRSKLWWSQGYINKVFVDKFEKEHRVKKLDPRIHFALNCGAQSCPPIRYYEHDRLDEQLDLATESFLYSEVMVDREFDEVTIPVIFEWFINDFGGRKGIISFLRKYDILREDDAPYISFHEYNWSPYIRFLV